MLNKCCSICNKTKSLEKFYNFKYGVAGKQPACMECQNERYVKYVAEVKANPAKIIRNSKTCQMCKNVMPISMFGTCNNKPDKKMSYCKPCWRKYVDAAKLRQMAAKRSKV